MQRRTRGYELGRQARKHCKAHTHTHTHTQHARREHDMRCDARQQLVRGLLQQPSAIWRCDNDRLAVQLAVDVTEPVWVS
jgi:hypothetical protein